MPILAVQPIQSRAEMEAHLLDLFAPTAISREQDNKVHARNMASLWRIDAIHRARNLAQLSLSLAHAVTDPADQWTTAAAAPARALARTYEALGFDNESPERVTCFEMISDIAVRLGQMFGRARNIAVRVAGDEVYVLPEQRRALALICSELVINALKYAFPDGGPGVIVITLSRRRDGIKLVVADNGIGMGDVSIPGQGSGLLERLAAVSGAVMARSQSRDAKGLRVTVGIPDAACVQGKGVA